MNRFYLIDKPKGITSFDVIRILRKKLHIKKMGHTGTLDPLATGMLFVATGNYTKLIPFFEKDVKTYQTTFALNGTTPSYDSETDITFISKQQQKYFAHHLTQEHIQHLLDAEFSGTISQVPPLYSAIKIDGKKALEYARSGKNIEIKSREVTIFSCKILSYRYPFLELEVTVSAGTYIRSLAHDLGEKLKTGGYITDLRRIRIATIDEKYAQNLDAWDEKNTVPLKHVFQEEYMLFLEENEKKELDFWRKIPIEKKLQEWKKYFVIANDICTHVVKYSEGFLLPERKI